MAAGQLQAAGCSRCGAGVLRRGCAARQAQGMCARTQHAPPATPPFPATTRSYLAGTSPAGEVDALTVKAIAPEAGQTRSGSGIVVAANGQGGDANLAIQTTGGDSDLDGDLLVGSALFADGPASLGSVSTQALSVSKSGRRGVA